MMTTTTNKRSNRNIVVIALTLAAVAVAVDGFAPLSSASTSIVTGKKGATSSSTATTTLSYAPIGRSSSSPSSSSVLYSSNPSNIAEFEYQELKLQLNAMKEQNVLSSQLPLKTRQEFEAYCRRIVNRRYDAKSIPLNEIGKEQNSDTLVGTQWKLLFSTQSIVDESLPIDTTIGINFISKNKLEYVLYFGKKIFGLNELIAVSSYEFDTGLVNPGLLTFTYEDIKTNMFGMKNMGLGMFGGGLLQGRTNYISTAYMDSKLWIEQGIDNATGSEYFNVYLKDDDDDGSNSKSSSSSSKATTSATKQSPLGGISSTMMDQQWDD